MYQSNRRMRRHRIIDRLLVAGSCIGLVVMFAIAFYALITGAS